jgi:hypothetical protein
VIPAVGLRLTLRPPGRPETQQRSHRNRGTEFPAKRARRNQRGRQALGDCAR